MSDEFVITRVFDAPRDLVFKAHTECERLKRWWGPKNFTMTFCTLDLRPGGAFHYCLKGPSGQDMWGKFVYREIVAPERLVFLNSFSDEKGGVTRNPWSATWPLEVLNTATFTEQGGKTTLAMRSAPYNANPAEREAFKAGMRGMEQGFGGTFEQLDRYLEELRGRKS